MRVALAQFDPSPDPDINAKHLVSVVHRAADQGISLVLAPEGSLVAFLTDPQAPRRSAQPLDGPFVSELLAASRRFGVTIAAGTFVPVADSDRVSNTLVIAQAGSLVAAYQKVHLYDAFSYLESDVIAAGSATPPVIDVDGVKVGFATCYDLRFPELFRVLQQGGAEVLALASAWVKGPLKEEHWLTLLRARAIENTCYVVAADQVGRAGIGRSAAFDPFGLPLLDLGVASPGFGVVDIDTARVAEVRDTLPSVWNARFRIDRVPSPQERPGAFSARANRG